MAELSTTEEEESSNSYLNWDDEGLGKLVKKKALELEDYLGDDTIDREAALIVLLSEVAEKDTDIGVMEVKGVRADGKSIGDWRITFERVDVDPGSFGEDGGGSGGVLAP